MFVIGAAKRLLSSTRNIVSLLGAGTNLFWQISELIFLSQN